MLPDGVEAELLHRQLQRQVEDELLHEHRSLEQRVRLTGVLGEVLVQVAEETGVQIRVREVVDHLAVGAPLTPERQQRGGGLVRGQDLEERVVRGVEEALHRPVGLGQRVEGSQQPVPVVQGRVLPEEVLVPVLRLRERSPEPESHASGISPLSSLKPSATITTAGPTFPIFLCPRTADGSRTGPTRTVPSAAPSCQPWPWRHAERTISLEPLSNQTSGTYPDLGVSL